MKASWSWPPRREAGGVFVFILLLAIILQYIWTGRHDPYKCQTLRDQGHWFDDHTWLTPGCATERYHADPFNECLNGRRIVLAGGQDLQHLYWSILQKLDGGVVRGLPVEGNLHHGNGLVTMDYFYDPSLEGFGLASVYEAYLKHKGESPAILILGAGDPLIEKEPWSFAVRMLRYTMASRSDHGAPVGGRHGFPSTNGEGQIVLALPAHQLSAKYVESTLQPAAYDKVNEELERMAREKGIDVLWAYNEMKHRRGESRLSEDEFDIEVSRQLADVVLGMRCNTKLAATGRLPNTRTCCASWSGPNWIQICLLVLSLGVLPLAVIRDIFKPVVRDTMRPLLRAVCGFSMLVGLQFLTDRTHLFEQGQAMPLDITNMKGMLVLVLLIGAFTVESSSWLDVPVAEPAPSEQLFLPREQTNEWKGLMQLLILIFQYNRAWDAHWFWEVIQLAVSSYLFLTGFGHTLYFLQTQDYSLRRVVAVLLRINLLPVALAYVMRTRWLLYWYMPLTTFWFLVIYATLAFAPVYNSSRPMLLGKMVVSATLVRAFIRTPDLDQTVVRLFNITCGISFDAEDFFQHRVQTDEYIVYIGMLVAISYLWIQEILSTNEAQSRLAMRFRNGFPILKRGSVIAAAIALVSFLYYDHTRIHSEVDWTSRQALMSFVPILAFAILRNAHPVLSDHYSTAFAWLGQYSGEIYVMQHHIFQAGDNGAVLRTGLFHGDDTLLGDRWRDLLVIIPLFIIACSVVGDATVLIARWFVREGPEEQPSVSQDAMATNEVELGMMNGAKKSTDAREQSEKKQDDPMPMQQRYGRFKLWPETVRNRVVLVLGVMWALNMAYT